MESIRIIANATIITCNAQMDVVYDGALAISGTTITALGSTESVLRSFRGAEVIDGKGKAVFPGLINCHSHSTSLFNRGISDDFGFPSTYRFPVPVTSMASEDDLKIIVGLSAAEAIRSGSTTVVEIGSNVASYAEILANSGLRWVLAESVSDGVVQQGYLPGESVSEYSEERREREMARAYDLFEGWNGTYDGKITCMASAQLVETTSPSLLSDVKDLADRYNAMYTIHLSQSPLEVQSLLEMRSARPTQSLFINEFLGPKLLAAHCRFLDETEIELLGTTDTKIAHQPAMAARRGMMPPVPAIRNAGCTIGLGTDNSTQDMVEVMRSGLFTERILREDGSNPQPEDYLKMATIEGAEVLGQSQLIGSLEVGKAADLFVVDAYSLNLLPTNRIVSSLINNGSPANIESVMVNGNWLMRDSKILVLDERELAIEADRVGRRAWRRLVEEYPSVKLPIELPPE